MRLLVIILIGLLASSAQARTMLASMYPAHGMIAAHKTLRFGTRLTVKYGHRTIVVRIADRGPFIRGRELDLSNEAARALRFSGLGRVRIESWPPLPRKRPEVIQHDVYR